MPSKSPRTRKGSTTTVQHTLDLNDQTTRHLRARKHTSDDEGRGFDVTIPHFKASVNEPEQRRGSAAALSQAETRQRKGQLFENPQFQKWTSAVTKGYKTNSEAAEMAIASTLAMQLGEDVLAKMVMEAKLVASTKGVDVKLEEAQLHYWPAKQQTAEQVFRALKHQL